MPTNLRRWWTESMPVLRHWEKRTPLNGWAYPIVPVTKEFQRDFANAFRAFFANHRRVHHDFNRDLDVYAWWPIAPFARVVYWWSECRWRFIIEYTLRGRVIDKPEGHAYTWWTWKVRPLRAWTWRRTRGSASR